MSLKLPEPKFDIRHMLNQNGRYLGFEARSESLKEDVFRIKGLLRYLHSPRMQQRHSKRATMLVKSQIAAKGETISSSIYMRSRRRRWIGAVLKLAASNLSKDLKLFTLVPQRGWCVEGSDLAAVDPKQFLARFRQQLVRQGIGRSTGWCIVYLHGEYDPISDTYQLHLHALAAGDTIGVMSELRLLPMYRRALPGAQVRVKRPCWKQRWKDPARQASYLVQGFWPSKPTYVVAGRTYRNRQRQRIPAPRFAEYLVWLDRFAFDDFVLLFGCRAAGGQLVPTRKRRTAKS